MKKIIALLMAVLMTAGMLAACSSTPAEDASPTVENTKAQAETALRNALRYVPEELHAELAPEFMEELVTRGRIYAYRFRPEGRIYGKPIDEYLSLIHISEPTRPY